MRPAYRTAPECPACAATLLALDATAGVCPQCGVAEWCPACPGDVFHLAADECPALARELTAHYAARHGGSPCGAADEAAWAASHEVAVAGERGQVAS